MSSQTGIDGRRALPSTPHDASYGVVPCEMASSFSCSGDARGINLRALTVIDDPVAVCPAGQWQRGPSAEADAPVMWRPRLVNGSLRLSAAWPPKCDRRTGTMWRGRWTSTSRMSQCERGSPGVEYCVLRVTDATVLASGLVINATHRFNLAHSHVGLEGPWEGDGFGADGTAPKAPSCTRIVKGALYTFRQKFSHNPGHTLLQTLPLLALALPELLRSENANATVLAPSALFQLLAQQVRHFFKRSSRRSSSHLNRSESRRRCFPSLASSFPCMLQSRPPRSDCWSGDRPSLPWTTPSRPAYFARCGRRCGPR